MAVLVFKVKLVLLVSKDLAVPRVTRVIVASVARKVFVVRRDCLDLVVRVVTREIKVFVVHPDNQVLVVYQEFKEKLEMLVEWVLVVLVVCLVNVDCLELVVSVVHVVVLARMAHEAHVVLLENRVRWVPEASQALLEKLESVAHKDCKVLLARWDLKARMESMARRELVEKKGFLDLQVCLVARVPEEARVRLELECQDLQGVRALVVSPVCKVQQAAGALQGPTDRLVCLERKERMVKMVRMASTARPVLLASQDQMVRRVQKEIAANLNSKFT